MLLNLRTALAGLALCASTATAAPVPAERAKAETADRAARLKAQRELAVVAARLHGAWDCLPCEGRLEFRPDGTYSWTDIAVRGGLSHSGYWSLRGSPDAPNLVLHCAVARVPEGGTTEEQGRTTEWKFCLEDKDGLTLDAPRFIPFAREEAK